MIRLVLMLYFSYCSLKKSNPKMCPSLSTLQTLQFCTLKELVVFSKQLIDFGFVDRQKLIFYPLKVQCVRFGGF